MHGRAAIARIATVIAMAIATSVATASDDPLVAFLEVTTTISADFEQELTDPDGRLVESSRGRLVIERPGRLRWDYDEPDQTVLADGERLWLFDREVDQVTISDQNDTLGGSPAALLAGSSDALDAFERAAAYTVDDVDWFELTPRADDVDFAVVRIGFAGSTLQAMVLDDRLGQQTFIRFSDMTLNDPVDDARFALEIPPYVDVVDNTKAPSDTPLSE
ncbi:MAG: outer membrane lipoprotein chaperone LolA [Pseudomonadota bacterium]